MRDETPIEIQFVPPRLRADFTGKLPEATSGTAEAREANFLSRALAAFAVHKLADCTMDQAAAAIVDGGGDGGIDALYFAPATSVLWVIQSKFFSDGRGEPDLGSVTKFKSGLEDLLQGHFDAFRANQAWTTRLSELEAIFGRGALQVRALLVYSGIHLVSEDRQRLFQDLKQRFSPDTDYFKFDSYNLTTIHDWVTGADVGPGVAEVALTIRKPGWLTQPYETVYGLIPLQDIVQLYQQHGKRLIADNIRGYKGNTDVNEQIVATVRDESQHFFYLNNGLTAHCDRLEVNNFDRGSCEEKRIRAVGFSIVNGAQTLGSLAAYLASLPPNARPNGYVFIKIISLERCLDDREFAERITRSTNYQNQIGIRDFVALDEQQERIAKQLVLAGVAYHFKDDVDAPDPDSTNFRLEEATTACACLEQQSDCDFIARVMANRKSLWSFDLVYPEEEPYRSRYHRLFRDDRSARTIWRAVQTQRIVIETMQNNGRTASGVRKTFFENARWLVLNIVFLKLRPEQADDLSLSPEEVTRISTFTNDLSEHLWIVCEGQGFVSRRNDPSSGVEIYEQTRHFRSIFSDAADCQRLRNAVLARLAQQQAAAPPPPSTTTI